MSLSAAVISPDSLLAYGLVRLLRAAHYRLAVAPAVAELRIPNEEVQPEIFIIISQDMNASLLEVTKIRDQSKSAKIIVLTDVADPAACAQIMRAGAVAYLPSTISTQSFINLLELVAAGEVVISPAALTQDQRLKAGVSQTSMRSGTMKSIDHKPLSLRETEILNCILDGDSNKHISRRFDIAETTVKVHVKSILRKINAENRTQAAIWALSHGLDTPAK